jgi:hypothetical protein
MTTVPIYYTLLPEKSLTISKTAYLQMKKEAKERPDKPAPYILWREDVSFESFDLGRI